MAGSFGTLAGSGSALALIASSSAFAEQPALAPQENTIVVTGDRAVHAALRGIVPERSYEEADVAGRGSSTVGEFIDEIRGENGDDQIILLVDGEPVADLDDLADYPAEAIANLEILPRGAGQRVGREANRRVYSLTLKDQLRSLTLAASTKLATEGAWSEKRGEATLTRIKGRDRTNLTLRMRNSGRLLESDRTIAGRVPTGFADADFVSPLDPTQFRTLRPDAREWDATLIGSTRFAPWLSGTYSLRGRSGTDEAFSGLPYGLFIERLPDNTDRLLALYGEAPLTQRSERRSVGGNFSLNVTQGNWLAGLTGQFTLAERTYRNEREEADQFGPRALPAGLNYRSGMIDPFLSRRLDVSSANQKDASVRLSVSGPILEGPAGAVRARGASEVVFARLDSTESLPGQDRKRGYSRDEKRVELGLDLPLASRRAGFLPALGEASAGLELVVGYLKGLPNSRRSTLSGLWQPAAGLSFTGSTTRTQMPPAIELLADPVIIYDDVASFDFIRGETVSASIVTGGNPALRPLNERVRQFTANASVWQAANMQVFADYRSVSRRDFVAAIPPASAAILAAFPDRFERDPQGRLVRIDSRPVNFDRQDQKELRYGLGFSIPLYDDTSSAAASAPRMPPEEGAAVETYVQTSVAAGWRLQGNAAHTVVFQDRVTIRPGLATIDLLQGGAIGLGGGRPRHQFDASLTLSRRGAGFGVSALYRGASTLATSDSATVSPLRFSPITLVNLRGFVDLGEMLSDQPWSKQTRLSLTINNLANDRQVVADPTGYAPHQYQAAYRDPIGRIVELELRKVF